MNTSVEPVAVPRWRFQVKHVLFLLGAVSLLLAPVHYFGMAYLITAGFSLALVAVCAAAYRSSAVGAVGVAALGLLFGFFIAIAAIPFVVHAFFNLLACVALIAIMPRPKYFAAGLLATMVAVYGTFLYSGMQGVREIKALKNEFPFESLDKRLAFEDERARSQSLPLAPVQLASHVASELNHQDSDLERSYWNNRSWALAELHEHTEEHFARAAGFGVMRMPSVGTDIVRLEPRVPLKLPVPIAISSAGSPEPRLLSLHKSTLYDFAGPERAAYVRSKRQAAGFESHGVSSLSHECEDKGAHNWQVTRFELVGLLRHDQPRVYIAASLPEMDQLADVPTRPLNTFEQAALAQLVSQENLVVSQQPGKIEMVGALRASNKCLGCHNGDRGKLLGAFSYELTPVPEKKTVVPTENTPKPQPNTNAVAF